MSSFILLDACQKVFQPWLSCFRLWFRKKTLGFFDRVNSRAYQDEEKQSAKTLSFQSPCLFLFVCAKIEFIHWETSEDDKDISAETAADVLLPLSSKGRLTDIGRRWNGDGISQESFRLSTYNCFYREVYAGFFRRCLENTCIYIYIYIYYFFFWCVIGTYTDNINLQICLFISTTWQVAQLSWVVVGPKTKGWTCDTCKPL